MGLQRLYQNRSIIENLRPLEPFKVDTEYRGHVLRVHDDVVVKLDVLGRYGPAVAPARLGVDLESELRLSADTFHDSARIPRVRFLSNAGRQGLRKSRPMTSVDKELLSSQALSDFGKPLPHSFRVPPLFAFVSAMGSTSPFRSTATGEVDAAGGETDSFDPDDLF